MKKFLFGPWPICSSEIFYTSKHCFGLINLKPIVPGHVLVIPRRVVPRFNSLTVEEVTDLMKCVQEISRVIEKEHKATSLTLTIQDGQHAGQSVPHVHMHIIPRVEGDWMNNDDIYHDINVKELELGIEAAKNGNDTKLLDDLSSKRRGVDSDREARSKESMAEEAAIYRSQFKQFDNIWD